MKQILSTILLATALLCSPLIGHADERFLSYDSEIQIHPDGWLTVTETIRHIVKSWRRNWPGIRCEPLSVKA